VICGEPLHAADTEVTPLRWRAAGNHCGPGKGRLCNCIADRGRDGGL